MTPVITTFTGLEVNPLDLRPENINPIDIAHALSLCNRFAGHTRHPLSVAQHSVYAAALVEGDRETKLRALLHDASEAYLGDMTHWLKQDPRMAAFREAEDRVQDAIFTRFGLAAGPMGDVVKRADVLLVQYEGKIGLYPEWKPMGGKLDDYNTLTREREDQIERLFGGFHFWHWSKAKARFMADLDWLTIGEVRKSLMGS